MIRSLQQARTQRGVLIATHRGMVAANIPHNTIPAFEIALLHGTDILETDVTRCGDGTMFVFHPGKEPAQLGVDVDIRNMGAEQVRQLRYLNDDRAATDHGILTLDAFLETYKNRCLINLDHGWKCFPDMIAAVRRHHIEDQILLKAPAKPEYFHAVEALAPDMMFMSICKEEDTSTALLESMNINFAGVELVFAKEDSPLVDEAYIRSHHEKGRLLWCNAILYDYKKQLSGGHTDDVAVTGDPDNGWGWIIDKGFDIIQTDWTMPLRSYLDSRTHHA